MTCLHILCLWPTDSVLKYLLRCIQNTVFAQRSVRGNIKLSDQPSPHASQVSMICHRPCVHDVWCPHLTLQPALSTLNSWLSHIWMHANLRPCCSVYTVDIVVLCSTVCSPSTTGRVRPPTFTHYTLICSKMWYDQEYMHLYHLYFVTLHYLELMRRFTCVWVSAHACNKTDRHPVFGCCFLFPPSLH